MNVEAVGRICWRFERGVVVERGFMKGEAGKMSDYESKIIRKMIRVYGRVQGVGFRYRASHAAGAVGVTGWVRNDPDGAVSMEIQGTEAQIDQVFGMISRGTYVYIERMDAKTIPLEEHEHGFRIREGAR